MAISEPIISKLKLNKLRIDTGLNTFSQAIILTIIFDQIGTINNATYKVLFLLFMFAKK